jgi:hypothetical protein
MEDEMLHKRAQESIRQRLVSRSQTSYSRQRVSAPQPVDAIKSTGRTNIRQSASRLPISRSSVQKETVSQPKGSITSSKRSNFVFKAKAPMQWLGRELKKFKNVRIPDRKAIDRWTKTVQGITANDILSFAKRLRLHVTDRRWRVTYFAIFVLVILLSAGFFSYQRAEAAGRYHLTAVEQKLVSPATASFSQLTYHSSSKQYVFNEAAFSGAQAGSTQIGDGNSPKTAAYGAKLATGASQSLTVIDKTTQLSFSLSPLFSEMPGEAVTNAGQPQTIPTGTGQTQVDHVVSPIKGQAAEKIYTVKENGIKEDLVLTAAPNGGQDSFSYKLELPSTLTAKLDANGNLGIYSADPSLFGNITFGDTKTEQDVEKARQNSPRDNLVFLLPAPVIYQSGSEASDPAGSQAKFTLNGDVLTVTATGLSNISYPATIDPSVVVASATNFQAGGNNEGNINFGTSGNQISTGTLTGGGVGAWSATTNIGSSNTDSGLMSVAYNGYIYTIGGYVGGTTGTNEVIYDSINTNGTLGGTWSSTTGLPAQIALGQAVAYNGYMYVMGGYNSSTSYYSNGVYYAPINANGTVGTWASTSAFATGREEFGATVYNGYVYIVGGYNNQSSANTYLNDVQYASFNADGTLGAWKTTTAMPNVGLRGMNVLAYNGYIYYLFGDNDNSGGYSVGNVFYYAPINTNGTIGSWVAMPIALNMSTGGFAGATINNGYLYIYGGYTYTDSNVYYATTYYAPINSDGTVGYFLSTSAMPVGTAYLGYTAYNGYLYALGGTTASSTVNTVDYTQINAAGAVGTAIAGGTLSTTDRGLSAVATNGYLFEVGGDNGSTPVTTVQYAAISSTGSFGTWSTGDALPAGDYRTYSSLSAYNGYLYLSGGCVSAYASCTTAGNNVTTVLYNSVANIVGSSSAWSSGTSFTTGRYGLGSFTYNGYLYIAGGLNGSTAEGDVQYIQLSSTGGTTGSWTTLGTSLSSTMGARANFGITEYGGYAYIAGGYTGSVYKNDLWYATVSNGGGIGTWTQAATGFTNARSELQTYAWNGYLYISGGWNGTTYYNDIQSVPLVSGVPGTTWTTVASSSTWGVRRAAAVAAYDGFVYVMGGYSGSAYMNDTYQAPINNGGYGGTGTWINNSTAFTTGRNLPAVVAYNGYLYIFGGDYQSTGALGDTQYAPINSNGSLGSWTTNSTTFTNSRWAFGAEAYNGYVYIMGGYSNVNGDYNDVQYAAINSNGSLGTWHYTYNSASSGSFVGGFTNARDSFAFAEYNGYLYIMGGINSGTSTAYNDIQYAPINSNGTIGTWTTNSTTFTNARQWPSGFAYNGYLYIMGGQTGGTSLFNDVQYAPINTNGSVGTWNYTTSFNTARQGLTAAADNGYVYIMGGSSQAGYSGAGYTNDVEYAPINSNGTIGNWSTSATLATTTEWSTQAVYNGYLYNVGGWNSSSDNLDVVQYAPVYAIARNANYSRLIDTTGSSGNGQTSSWTTNSNNFTNSRQYFGAVAYNGYLYIMGGQNGGSLYSDVQYAPINSNGSIGTWTTNSTSFTTARLGLGAVAYNGYLYIMGGDGSSGDLNDVQYAPINSNGSIGTWTTNSTSFTTTRLFLSAIATNGYLYIMGGDNSGGTALNDIQYAPINADGSIGTWTTNSTSFTTGRLSFSAIATNGYLYIMGGYNTAGTALGDTQYAPINSNGSIGTWTTNSTSFTTARASQSAVVSNGYLYIMGGENTAGTVLNDTQYAPINSDGSIGTWATNSKTFTTARANHSAVAYNGYLYIMGGSNSGGSPLGDTQYTAVNSDDPMPSSFILSGSNTGDPGLGGVSGPGGIKVQYRLAASACPIFGSSQSLSTGVNNQLSIPFALPAATTGCGISGDGRYLWVYVSLDDSQTASFPDSNGNHTTITSLSAYYAPSSGARLRGGSTFSGGSLQSLYTKL